MEHAGFLMLAAVAALMLVTGLPAFIAMVGVSAVFGTLGVLTGAIPPGLLLALPSRLIGLLETDLLQALPLYVFMGGLLNRLPLAETVFRAFARLAGRGAAAPVVAGLGVGALLAPMNGSVGASASMLTRVLRPRLAAAGTAPADSLAAIAAASTLGVTIPPSLVLILFGDAMLRAHTEAQNVTRAMARIINTQDVFRGALVPAALVLALFVLVCVLRARGGSEAEPARVPMRDWAVAAMTVAFIVALLGGVAAGYLYAVEAAATGAAVLAAYGIGSGTLRGAALRELLAETLTVTGALFALFIAATTLTLVFRAFGTDRVLAEMVTSLATTPAAMAALVLALIAACALVLDAFEIILVIVPLLMPPFLIRAPDAVWAAVLVLLVLQASFLLPPFGYAVLMTRGLLPETLRARAVLRAVAPFLAAQLVALGLVAAFPGLVHVFVPADTELKPVLSPEDARRQLEALPLPEEE